MLNLDKLVRVFAVQNDLPLFMHQFEKKINKDCSSELSIFSDNQEQTKEAGTVMNLSDEKYSGLNTPD